MAEPASDHQLNGPSTAHEENLIGSLPSLLVAKKGHCSKDTGFKKERLMSPYHQPTLIMKDQHQGKPALRHGENVFLVHLLGNVKIPAKGVVRYFSFPN